MADIVLDNQSASATPSSGQVVLFPETTGKKLTFKNDAGTTYTLGIAGIRNFATASQSGFTSDTYLTGSNVLVPASLTLQAGSRYLCRISLSKTAVGTATPVVTLRVGTAASTGDTAVLTFTGAAQTGAIDAGLIEIVASWNSIGASGILVGTFALKHNLASGAGLSGTDVIQVTGSAFNTTTASLFMGVSVNYGASVVLTIPTVEAEILNL